MVSGSRPRARSWWPRELDRSGSSPSLREPTPACSCPSSPLCVCGTQGGHTGHAVTSPPPFLQEECAFGHYSCFQMSERMCSRARRVIGPRRRSPGHRALTRQEVGLEQRGGTGRSLLRRPWNPLVGTQPPLPRRGGGEAARPLPTPASSPARWKPREPTSSPESEAPVRAPGSGEGSCCLWDEQAAGPACGSRTWRQACWACCPRRSGETMSWLCGILGRSTPLVREAGSAVCAGKTGQPGVRSLFPMSKVHVTVSATPGLWDVWRPGGGSPHFPAGSALHRLTRPPAVCAYPSRVSAAGAPGGAGSRRITALVASLMQGVTCFPPPGLPAVHAQVWAVGWSHGQCSV